MTAWRLYNLYRRAGNSPCQAFRLTEAHRPYQAPTVLFAIAVLLLLATVAISVTG